MMFRILALACSVVVLCSCSHQKPLQATTHIRVTMRKFAIDPSVIRVKQGQDVVLDVSTEDVEHGFEVQDLGIDEPIQPGKPAEIPLDTSKKGEFGVDCSIRCGSGHDDMTAKIVVQ
jgi:cytochrome c oxidase subunit 2